MLANTITIPSPSGSVVLTRINQDGYSSEYLKRTTTAQWRLLIRHSSVNPSSGRTGVYDRHNVEYTHTVFAVGDVPQYDRKVYFVTECKPGDSAIDAADGLFDLAIATSDALLTSLEAWES
jgi:hypothetical protein